MKINVSVVLGFTETDNVLKIDLDIPAGEMSKANPLKFVGTQTNTANDTTSPSNVLEVAVGDENNIYVAVAPPEYLLEAANVKDTIRSLEVKVQKGNYKNGAFA